MESWIEKLDILPRRKFLSANVKVIILTEALCTSHLLRNNIVFGNNCHLAYISVIINVTCHVGGTIRMYCVLRRVRAVAKSDF
jgi:hypothetical protein